MTPPGPTPASEPEPEREPPRGRSGLDRLLSDPTRLALMSTLCAAERCDFTFLRDSASLTDSALSKQIATLKKEGYAEVERTYFGRVPRTRVRATTVGRAVFLAHVEALRAIVAQAAEPAAADGDTPGDTHGT